MATRILIILLGLQYLVCGFLSIGNLNRILITNWSHLTDFTVDNFPKTVLDILFPECADHENSTYSYSERLWLGREAQGFSRYQSTATSSVIAGELTYGEFPWIFASEMIDTCLKLHSEDVSNLIFLDIGSGVGRLVKLTSYVRCNFFFFAGYLRRSLFDRTKYF